MSGLTGIMKSVLGGTQRGAAMFEDTDQETELNIFCSDLIVSTEFTKARMKHVRKTPSIVRLELEDLLEREDKLLFWEMQDILTTDHRKWDYVRFVDHVYSEERFQHYLDRKKQLWELLEKDVTKRSIFLEFTAVLEFREGSPVESVISLLKKVKKSTNLESIEFAGAMFGYLLFDIPKKLCDLCEEGILQDAVTLKLFYNTTESTAEPPEEGASLADAIADMGDDTCRRELGDEKIDDAPSTIKARSIRVVTSCLVQLRELVDYSEEEEDSEGNLSECSESYSSEDEKGKRGRKKSRRWKISKTSVKAIKNKAKLKSVRKGLKKIGGKNLLGGSTSNIFGDSASNGFGGSTSRNFGGSTSNIFGDSDSGMFGTKRKSLYSKSKRQSRSKSVGAAQQRKQVFLNLKNARKSSTQRLRIKQIRKTVEPDEMLPMSPNGPSVFEPIQTQEELANILSPLLAPGGKHKSGATPLGGHPLMEDFSTRFMEKKKNAEKHKNCGVVPAPELSDGVSDELSIDSDSTLGEMDNSLSLLDLVCSGDSLSSSSASSGSQRKTPSGEGIGADHQLYTEPSNVSAVKDLTSTEQLEEVALGDTRGVLKEQHPVKRQTENIAQEVEDHEALTVSVGGYSNACTEVGDDLYDASALATKKTGKKKKKKKKKAKAQLPSGEDIVGGLDDGFQEAPKKKSKKKAKEMGVDGVFSRDLSVGEGSNKCIDTGEDPYYEPNFAPKKKKKKSQGILANDVVSVELPLCDDSHANIGATEASHDESNLVLKKKTKKKKKKNLDAKIDGDLSADLSAGEYSKGSIGATEEQTDAPEGVRRKKLKKKKEKCLAREDSDAALSMNYFSTEEEYPPADDETQLTAKKKRKKKKGKAFSGSESDAALSVNYFSADEFGDAPEKELVETVVKKEKRRKKKKYRDPSFVDGGEREILSVDGNITGNFEIVGVETSLGEISQNEVVLLPERISKKERRRRKKEAKEMADTDSIGSLSLNDVLDLEHEEPTRKDIANAYDASNKSMQLSMTGSLAPWRFLPDQELAQATDS